MKDQFKLVILGDSAVGKTSFVERITNGDFIREHKPTYAVDMTDYSFYTNLGQINFRIWDLAGKEENKGLEDGYLINADCILIIFDLTSTESYRSLNKWYKMVKNIIPDVPIVICGNKSDSSNRKIHHMKLPTSIKYYDISVKSCYNLDKPMIYLIEKLLFYKINLSTRPTITPPLVEIY
jgi:GTP-binding nuclear protein Ran